MDPEKISHYRILERLGAGGKSYQDFRPAGTGAGAEGVREFEIGALQSETRVVIYSHP